jgi:hypothetical protein
MINATLRSLYPRERYPVSIVQEAGLASGPVWTGLENLELNRVRNPDRLYTDYAILAPRY